jgi:hypothetical protein
MYQKDLTSALVNVALRRGSGGFTFDDLARAVQRHEGTFSDLAEWLAQARSSGFVEDLGFDADARLQVRGPRRYRIASRTAQQRAAG